MKITIEKATGTQKCRYQKCDKNPLYITAKGRIITGSTCANIRLNSAGGNNSSYYCRECVDKIYIELKSILNLICGHFNDFK